MRPLLEDETLRGHDEIIMQTPRGPMTRLNLEIPAAIKRQAKIKATREHRTLTSVIEDLLRRWLKEGDQRKQKRLILGEHDLGAPSSLRRRDIYEDLP